MSNWYKAPDEPGLAFGAYRMENTARNASERSLVEKDHREFIQYLNELNQMQELAELWHEVSALTESMKSIGKKLLKSGDVLYSCMFCRHLWK